ncbi:MAG: hypothetical protein NCW75_15420 [Phycisphaera sp.]|nr:MAG: hypothetical protein NCW75_15420 [Phycisphaera sp.]
MRNSIATLMLLAGAATGLAQTTGPNSSAEPYVDGTLSDARSTSILTVGDSPTGSDYRMVGIPDGMGGYDNGDGTFTVLMNHELGTSAGVVREHGAIGAFVSKWTIDADTLEVIAGEDLIKRVFVWTPFVGYTESFSETLNRLCSADLPPVSAFYDSTTGLGTTERIFMSGEETRPPFSADHGRAFAHVVTGDDAGVSYEIPAVGKMAHENVLANPFEQVKTIVIPMDDADRSTAPGPAPCELYVYVGEKQPEGSPADKAGLTNGTLYGVQVVRFDGTTVVEESNEFGFGDATTGYVGQARFELIDLGDVRDMTGIELQTESIAQDITRWQRIEDGAWDVRDGRESDFYWVTTASSSLNSRLFANYFDDITNPEAGGVIEILLQGDEGQQTMDNMGIDNRGNVVIQEDPGGSDRLAKIWNYNVDSGVLTEIAASAGKFFTEGEPEFITTNEESSGAFYADDLLGEGWWLMDMQVHEAEADPELVQGGQLYALFNPLSACVADFDGSATLNVFDFLAFFNAYNAGDLIADLNGDGSLDMFDFQAFQNAFDAGCVLD